MLAPPLTFSSQILRSFNHKGHEANEWIEKIAADMRRKAQIKQKNCRQLQLNALNVLQALGISRFARD
jgi:hypothetical protein